VTSHKIDEIRKAARDYGRESLANYKFCLRLKDDVIVALNDYLAVGDKVAVAVPQSGDWNPEEENYRDEALGMFDEPIVILRDLGFGIAIRLDNLEDSGHCWVRVPVSLRKTSQNVEITVGAQPIVRIPLDYQDHLTRLCEATYKDLLAIFRDPVLERRPDLQGPIGFVRRH
jgi:hypothetical protein